MRAFHGSQEIKDKYIARVRKHRELDHLIQGVGWENGRGCAIGCTLESYDHSRYPDELGLPMWLAYIVDHIFENLPTDNAMEWPEQVLSAIPVGADVEKVRHQLAIRWLNRLIELPSEDEYKGVMGDVRDCHQAELDGNQCDWSAAWNASEHTAWSAAEHSVWSSYIAASSSDSAAWLSEWSAYRAWSAYSEESAESARIAAWKQEADDLLDLLEAV